jgi:hypothetical protein
MTLRRSTIATLALTALSFLLSACHAHWHVPPGQLKHVVAPPPGHTGTPPGQKKKH